MSHIVGLGPHRAARRGFTLVEVMLAIMILGVTAATLAGAVVIASRSAHVNGEYSQAISLCQHKIDQLRAVGWGRLNYEELSDAAIIDETPANGPFSFASVDNVSDYLIQPTATVTLTTVDADRTLATVRVTWRNTKHNTRTSAVSLTALVANVE